MKEMMKKAIGDIRNGLYLPEAGGRPSMLSKRQLLPRLGSLEIQLATCLFPLRRVTDISLPPFGIEIGWDNGFNLPSEAQRDSPNATWLIKKLSFSSRSVGSSPFLFTCSSAFLSSATLAAAPASASCFAVCSTFLLFFFNDLRKVGSL